MNNTTINYAYKSGALKASLHMMKCLSSIPGIKIVDQDAFRTYINIEIARANNLAI